MPTSYIGTAGWSIPREQQRQFPAGDSHLARYAKVFPAVEINSTFYRTHQAATFERWAATVPRAFRFSIKVPRAITHDHRLRHGARLLEPFLADLEPLGQKLGCLLVQLPPSLIFEPRVANTFFTALRRRFDRGVAIEPRHASWFQSRADRLLKDHEVARVAADPPRADRGGEPGGWPGLKYFRLHGSPRVYYSSYDEQFLARLARRVGEAPKPCWVIFDNTTLGAGTANALRLAQLRRK
jgi:uncharacterized protein YecE (DUF72 family)